MCVCVKNAFFDEKNVRSVVYVKSVTDTQLTSKAAGGLMATLNNPNTDYSDRAITDKEATRIP
jgi:hypothetical protein